VLSILTYLDPSQQHAQAATHRHITDIKHPQYTNWASDGEKVHPDVVRIWMLATLRGVLTGPLCRRGADK